MSRSAAQGNRKKWSDYDAGQIRWEMIPQELKERPQWVCWREEVRKGKATKVPVNVHTGRKAAVNRPETWANFNEALTYYREHQGQGIRGLGFVLTQDDPFVFIDLDRCIEPDTGALQAWALKIVERIGSYTEISPSGQGLHIIAKGSLPPNGRKKGQVEIYDQGRYMTMTGNHFRFSPRTIEDRHDELLVLHQEIFGQSHRKTSQTEDDAFSRGQGLSDAELIAKAHQAANGNRFAQLWRGDWQGAGYPSQSEADLALCGLLAFWTQGDINAIDRLFRQSGLFRAKWDERHYTDGRTYGEETIRKAVSGTTEFYQGKDKDTGAEDQEYKRNGRRTEGSSNQAHGAAKGEDNPTEEPHAGLGLSPPGWPAPMRSEAFQGLAGDFVRLLEPHTEADPAALLTQFLTVFGNVSGPQAFFQVEADVHHLKIFTCIVGETSKARKGTSFGHVKEVYQIINQEWAAHRIMSGLVSGEGLIWQVRDPITKLEPIKEKGRLTGEYNEIVIDPGIKDKRLLVFEPEFAATLRVMGRDGNILSAVIRQAWDGSHLSGLAKNSPGRATGAHISIIAHITKDELLRYLDRTEAANGFGNRFLWICVRRSKLLPEGGRISEVDFTPFMTKLANAVAMAQQAGRLSFDDGARQRWREIYGSLSEGKPGMFGALVSRAEAQVVRLACIYALLDRTTLIRREHLEAALAVWDYAEASVHYIFGDASGDPIADQIWAALTNAPDGLSQTDIHNLFGRNVLASRIHQALQLLRRLGVVVSETRGVSGGRPTIMWKSVTKKTN